MRLRHTLKPVQYVPLNGQGQGQDQEVGTPLNLPGHIMVTGKAGVGVLEPYATRVRRQPCVGPMAQPRASFGQRANDTYVVGPGHPVSILLPAAFEYFAIVLPPVFGIAACVLGFGVILTRLG